MEDFGKNIYGKKYPKSKHNRQCLGDCFLPGTWIIHPITLDYVTDPDHAFCAVNEWETNDANTGKLTKYFIDQCYIPTNEKDTSSAQIAMNILIPQIDFSCDQFLKIYYNIHSLEDTLNWIEVNQEAPLLTKLRIFDCSWELFGKNLDIIDDRIINFYIDVIKKKWIKKIYPILKNYIFIDENKEIFLSKNYNSSDEFKIEKINYFIKKFINKNNLYKFFVTYIENNRKNWQKIISHNKNIQNQFINYIKNKIEETLKT
ncbi:Hypothetical protein KVN_LOCUS262 [uncultured virus]|nr:Hypothetical protein KVN_LOCUS262 [uncultured virus]